MFAVSSSGTHSPCHIRKFRPTLLETLRLESCESSDVCGLVVVSVLVHVGMSDTASGRLSASVLSFVSWFDCVVVSRCSKYPMFFFCRPCLRCQFCLVLRSGRQAERPRVHLDVSGFAPQRGRHCLDTIALGCEVS